MSAEQDTLTGNGEDVNIFYASLPAATCGRVPFRPPVPPAGQDASTPTLFPPLPVPTERDPLTPAASRPSHRHPPLIPTTSKPPDTSPTSDSCSSNPDKISNSLPRQTLGPYRDCPERRSAGRTGRAVGAVSIGSFELSRWRLRRTRWAMGFQSVDAGSRAFAKVSNRDEERRRCF